MPQVPYKGYPDLGPERVPAHVEIPGAIFEGTRALEGFGRQLQGAGDELFNRAMALKADQNSTEADEANVKYMTGAGELHAAFNAKQGKERVDAYPKYKTDLTSLRDSIANTMSNDQSRRLFLGKSIGTLGHSIFNGAGAAATAQKEWNVSTATSVMDTAVKTVSDDPLNDSLWETKKAEITNAGNKIAWETRNAPPGSAIAEAEVAKGINAAAKQRILSVANIDPPRAHDMLRDSIQKKEIFGQDATVVDNVIRARWHSIEAANIGNQAYEDNKETPDRPARPDREVVEEIRAKVRKLEPTNTVLAEDAVRVYQNRVQKENQIQRSEKESNEQIIWGAVRDFNPTSMQELRAIPKVGAAIDALKPSVQKNLEADLNRYLKNKDLQEKESNFRYLRGLPPMQFLEKNLLNEKLTESEFKTLMNLREKYLKNPQDDPRIGRAMEWLRSSMGETLVRLNLASSKDNNQEYYKFRGGLQVALDAYQETHGKPADRKAVQDEIGPTLVKEFSFPGRIWGTNTYPLYKPPTYAAAGYDDFAKKVRADAAIKGTELNNEQVERMWKRMLYLKAQEGKLGK